MALFEGLDRANSPRRPTPRRAASRGYRTFVSDANQQHVIDKRTAEVRKIKEELSEPGISPKRRARLLSKLERVRY